MLYPANSGMPAYNSPGFQPVSGVSKPEMQAAQVNRFGAVLSHASPWQPQFNGVPTTSVPGIQQNARVPPPPTNASPFLQQYSHPPSASSTDAGIQNAMSASMTVGPPPVNRSSPAQVCICSLLLCALWGVI